MTFEDLLGPSAVGPPAQPLDPETVNLRAATNPQQACATCQHFIAENEPCRLGVPTQATLVCDAFAPKAAGQDIEAMLFGGPNG